MGKQARGRQRAVTPPQERWTQPVGVCRATGKVMQPDGYTAALVARTERENKGALLNVYRCRWCRRWHLGSPDQHHKLGPLPGEVRKRREKIPPPPIKWCYQIRQKEKYAAQVWEGEGGRCLE